MCCQATGEIFFSMSSAFWLPSLVTLKQLREQHRVKGGYDVGLQSAALVADRDIEVRLADEVLFFADLGDERA